MNLCGFKPHMRRVISFLLQFIPRHFGQKFSFFSRAISRIFWCLWRCSLCPNNKTSKSSLTPGWFAKNEVKIIEFFALLLMVLSTAKKKKTLCSRKTENPKAATYDDNEGWWFATTPKARTGKSSPTEDGWDWHRQRQSLANPSRRNQFWIGVYWLLYRHQLSNFSKRDNWCNSSFGRFFFSPAKTKNKKKLMLLLSFLLPCS